MRQITRKAVEALLVGSNYKKSNTEVRDKALYLFGHKIAWFDINERLWIDNCGYLTTTTKERLNALPGVRIQQVNFSWYLNGEYWDGSPKCIGKIL